jgi:hypothetical protein
VTCHGVPHATLPRDGGEAHLVPMTSFRRLVA